MKTRGIGVDPFVNRDIEEGITRHIVKSKLINFIGVLH